MNVNETAGQSVRLTSRRLYGEAGRKALIAAVLLAVGIAVGAAGGGGVGAILVGAGVFVAIDVRQRVRSARRFKIGAIAEERVGSRLWELESWGWLVEQDVQKRGGGNVDHIVHSPLATFVIDTKASRCRARDIAQAHRHAEWASLHFGDVEEIVAVVCIQGSKQRAEFVDGVYTVGASHLVGFLLDRG